VFGQSIWMQNVPIQSITGAQVNLQYPLVSSFTNVPVSLLIPSGKTYSYLAGDKFKMVYEPLLSDQPVPVPPLATNPRFWPVLLDTWGQPILYFPVYNSAVSTASPPVPIPLFGSPGGNYTHATASSTPATPASVAGNSVFWDGAHIPLDVANNINGGLTPEQMLTVQWKLGDNSNGVPDNTIGAGENLNLPQPFLLISAGADQVFLDMSQPPASVVSQGAVGITSWRNQQIKNSQNVYNIDQ
jgi:hypothetical protein